jgi:hypothetical protein
MPAHQHLEGGFLVLSEEALEQLSVRPRVLLRPHCSAQVAENGTHLAIRHIVVRSTPLGISTVQK